MIRYDCIRSRVIQAAFAPAVLWGSGQPVNGDGCFEVEGVGEGVGSQEGRRTTGTKVGESWQ